MNRIPYFDNVKSILIILVVAGHIAEDLRGSFGPLSHWYTFIYIFHMPMFILISGYFSKPSTGFRDIIKDFKKLMIPYFIFQFIFTIICYLYEPPTLKSILASFVVPRYMLWYLPCLFFWRLLLPYLLRLPFPFAFSLILGVLVGFLPGFGNILSISRTFVFFPFFIAGYYFRGIDFFKMKDQIYKVSLISILVFFVVTFFFNGDSYNVWLKGKLLYSQIGNFEWDFILFRLAMYLAGFILGISFLSLVPNKKYAFTFIGPGTLYVYLLHGIIIYWAIQTRWFYSVDNIYIAIILFISAIPLTFLLSSNFIKKSTKFLVEPVYP